MRSSVETLVDEGREAFLRGDGAASRRAFEGALQVEVTGALLEGLGRARYLEADYGGSLEAHERAFAAYRSAGDRLGAARAGRMLAWIHGNLHGDWAIAGGWLRRARRLLEAGTVESPERGWVEVLLGSEEPDPERRGEHFRRALELAGRFGDRDLEIEAIGWVALDALVRGRVEEGMRLLDEALAAACAGEVEDLYVVEGIFCGMFTACERIHDVARAEQWMRAADLMVARRRLVAVGAFCRAHYGAILTDAGRWDEAEAQLATAARVFEEGYVAQRADVLARLADLRVRQGRLDEAAELLVGLDQHPSAIRPLAALRLARGERALARDLLERALETAEGADDPSPLLGMLVDAHLGDGRIADAEVVAARLAELAERQPGPYVRGRAALARGSILAAAGQGDARGHLLAAIASFGQAGTPMELGRARLALARTVAADRPEVALEEARAALATFTGLEARADASAAAAVVRELEGAEPAGDGSAASGRSSGRAPGTLTSREAEVLRRIAAGQRTREIAADLVISEHTVARHVQNIFAKLGVSSRAAATAVALERDLVRGSRS